MATAAVLSQVVMDANTVSTIVNNINSLYSNALNQIIALTLGLLAIGGVLLPLIIAYYQRRKAVDDQIILTKRIEDEVGKAKEALSVDLKMEMKREKELFDAKISEIKHEIEVEIKRIHAAANAKIHHHIAVTSLANNLAPEALKQITTAICDYVIGKDEQNMQRALTGNLLNTIFPKLKKVDFEADEELVSCISVIISSVESINVNGRYAEVIKDVRNAYKNALARPA